MTTAPTRQLLRRRKLMTATAIGIIGKRVAAQAPIQQDPWPSLAAQIFNDRPIQDGSEIVVNGARQPHGRARRPRPVAQTLRSAGPDRDAQRVAGW